MRTLPKIDRLPHALYTAQQVREFDRLAIEEFGVPGKDLMERAGAAAFAELQARWPQARRIVVLCGTGNNGGDGYVIARLAREAGLEVRVLQLGSPGQQGGDAMACREQWGEPVEVFGGSDFRGVDVIVDAMLGTGLSKPVTDSWRDAIDAANNSAARILAVDIPSGLHADTGVRLGAAIQADVTVSFIALKRGLFTGDGPDVTGDVVFDGLEVPARVFAREMLSAMRLDMAKLGGLLEPRPRVAHKGMYGHVLVIGGDYGYAGAAVLAGKAAARVGAGLVSVVTHPQHVAAVAAACPEIMVRGIENVEALSVMLERASVLALGPGMGRSDWSRLVFHEAVQSGLPMVVDADGPNCLAERPACRDDWVLTPHPGEAARLLDTSTSAIHADRYQAATLLQQRYGGVVVLKGAGTVICDREGRLAVNTTGNPGMATGGMGDILTGVVASLVAQGLGLEDAARLGVCIHGLAGDRASQSGERGLMASDLFPHLRKLVNERSG